jgi:mannose-6-phosphate isomerase
MLGQVVRDRFGERLPFLLKLLAADAPLSIQVHPDADQAADGFAHRGYRDPYAKPELLVALTDFEALCGWRAPTESAVQLAGLGVPALAAVVDALRGPDPLRRALCALLAWPQGERADLVAAVVATGHPLAVRLSAHYPGDVGVVVAFLLNHLRLVPGEAIFMPPGNVHAYLGGAGVEIMGASDNVLRAGLTVKPIDPDEFTRLVRFEVLADPRFAAAPLGPGCTAWSPGVAEFRLVLGTVRPPDPVTLPGSGPRIVVCVRGSAALRAGAAEATLTPGRAVFVGAAEPAVEVSGDAAVFQASPAE